MILIISDNNDRTTIEVIRWLVSMDKNFILINDDEFFEIKVDKKRFLLQSENKAFFLDEIESMWYRRGGLQFKRLQYHNDSINIHMNEAQHWLEDYVLTTLESRRHVNKQSNSHVNKLLVLEYARKAGMQVPQYFLAENTDDVILNRTITKSITGNVILDNISEKRDGIMYTTIIREKEKKPFFTSFFQEKIEKDFEIRTFYLNGECFSMAIFSQNDEQTQTDFRKYNDEKPNRNIRYNLPKEVEMKIQKLMKLLDLNCGSLDFIKSGEVYYFLEVNPVGQFANVAYHCNYPLFKKIADYL
ncbi:grasp-with-spasm system ATP-grasp peptide maturase [Chryseobacterium shigense]|uniref:ATP-GRASP peptide maturase, grasp-with-spasm system n=1 Tax=Chryseobacterium shigense TaxID=297244 RepID=A0A1N7IA29_9FLAO|nr:grasp-with-spasm system ATP-grasp peptide maturase [Chryseobacterium shigense]PQA96810.1 grasp-with-spasm system ATP-grasp peptide maturase [Chryseobacterium shigense]SIS33917.1 ATP-GRASP peptide maturase, grasp-with-spasm system [Chryseobacterium shigense]